MFFLAGSKRGDQGPKAPQKDEVYGFLPGKGVLKRIGTLPTRLRKNTTKTPPDGDAPTAGTSPLKPHQSMSLARTNISDPAIRKPLEIQIPDGPSASENPQSGAPLKGCVNKTQQCPTPTACQKVGIPSTCFCYQYIVMLRKYNIKPEVSVFGFLGI